MQKIDCIKLKVKSSSYLFKDIDMYRAYVNDYSYMNQGSDIYFKTDIPKDEVTTWNSVSIRLVTRANK